MRGLLLVLGLVVVVGCEEEQAVEEAPPECGRMYTTDDVCAQGEPCIFLEWEPCHEVLTTDSGSRYCVGGKWDSKECQSIEDCKDHCRSWTHPRCRCY